MAVQLRNSKQYPNFCLLLPIRKKSIEHSGSPVSQNFVTRSGRSLGPLLSSAGVSDCLVAFWKTSQLIVVRTEHCVCKCSKFFQRKQLMNATKMLMLLKSAT